MPRGTARWIGMLALIATACMLFSGCGSLRLYSEARDKQGTQAADAWAEVDIGATLDAERANLDALLAEELATADRMAASIRDQALGAFVGAPTLKEGLVDEIDARLIQLLGSPESVHELMKLDQEYRRIVAHRASDEDDFKSAGLAVPSCTSIAGGKTPAEFGDHPDRFLAILLQRARERCDGEDKYIYNKMAEAIRLAYPQYEQDAEVLRKLEEDALPLRDGYVNARKQYEAAMAGTDAGSRNVEAMEKALRALEDASQNPLAVQFVSRERLEALDRFIQAVAGSDGEAPEDASHAELTAILLPALIDDARASLADAKKPLALPLLVRRNHEQLKWEAATREVAIRRKRVALAKEWMHALNAQVVQLNTARSVLNAPEVKALYGETVLNAFTRAGPREKDALYQAAGLHFDALNRHAARSLRLEYMRNATSYDIGLAYSEVNVRQWQSLIGATVSQVADSAGGGLRPERISALLNALGLIWIGWGVNK